jgi:hypothetical protein
MLTENALGIENKDYYLSWINATSQN